MSTQANTTTPTRHTPTTAESFRQFKNPGPPRGVKNPGNLCSIISLTQAVKYDDFLLKACEQANKPETQAMAELSRCLNTSQNEQPTLQLLRDLVARHLPSHLAGITDKGGFRSHQCVAEVFKAIFQDEESPTRRINCFDDDITSELAELTRQVRRDLSGSFAVIEITEYECLNISCLQKKTEAQSLLFAKPPNIDSADHIHKLMDGSRQRPKDKKKLNEE